MKFIVFLFFTFLSIHPLSAQDSSSKTDSPAEKPRASELPVEVVSPSIDDIVTRVEKRYSGPGFSARFDQRSTLKDVQITDKGFGKVFIKRPGMMRWEYEAPDKQIIITDGNKLWMYRPDENQVTVGYAPDYFRDGKGASFLSDIRVIRQNFDVSFEKKDDPDYHVLKLLPKDKEKKYDISHIFLSVSKKTGDVAKIITYNTYGDETAIELSSFQLNQKFDDAMFSFVVPEGTDILQMEEEGDKKKK
ncbi:MAG: outer membrane lipoprotein carrier protein LolA [Desulfobacteraceae bacterium IS3]|nr:MAG: outer membrane lipoprotein carrier protein LolA [Desulfobacteraceae bacterium IS3]